MRLNTGLHDLMVCKASALSTMERNNKNRLPLKCCGSARCLGGGEGLWGGAANSDEANSYDLQANDS